MRHLGVDAFQTVRFPQLPGAEIKRLHHLALDLLLREHLLTEPELGRALAVSEPVIAAPERRIHLAGDLLEVMLNLRRWNEELRSPEGRARWGRRTITYFVFDPRPGQFAPRSSAPTSPFRRQGLTLGEPLALLRDPS